MSSPDEGGWFAYSPLADNDHLTPERKQRVSELEATRRATPPPGDVRVLLHSLEPGQAEVRVQVPPGLVVQPARMTELALV